MLKPITKRDGPGLGKSVIAVESLNGEPYLLWNLYKNGNSYYIATCDDVLRPPTNWKIIDEIAMDATDFSIDFDGRWIYKDGRYRLQTEGLPYIFWVDSDGVLWVRRYGSDTPTELSTGVDLISTLRGWKSTVTPEDDEGLIVSYVKNNSIFYRNYCIQADGSTIWETERQIQTFSNQVVSASLFLLNDFRSGVVAETIDGNIHWMITKRMWAGMAIPAEYIASSISAVNVLVIPVEFKETNPSEEYISVDVGINIAYSEEISPQIIAANNLEDEETVVIALNYPATNNLSEPLSISVVDDASASYAISQIAYGSSNSEIVMKIRKFSGASGNLHILHDPNINPLRTINNGVTFAFTTTDFSFKPVLKPNDGVLIENITTTVSLNVVPKKVDYVYGYASENITSSISSVSIVVTKVGESPL